MFGSSKTYLEEKAKAHPLVVPIQFLVLFREGRLDPRIPLVRLRFFILVNYSVSGMDPAECVEHILWYIFRVDAVDGVPDVLPRRYDQAERNEYEHGDRIMQSEDG